MNAPAPRISTLVDLLVGDAPLGPALDLTINELGAVVFNARLDHVAKLAGGAGHC